MGNRGSVSRYKSPKKSLGGHIKSGLKKAAGTLKSSLLGSATPEAVQKPTKTGTKVKETGFKKGLKKAVGKVAKGWHKG